MLTSRSLPLVSSTFLSLFRFVTALPQDPAAVTQVEVVTVFAGGHGAGLGTVETVIAATGGVAQQAGDRIATIAPVNGGVVAPTTVGIPPDITPAPSFPQSNPLPVAPGCDQCSIYFKYVSAYYWPTPNSNNTACLAGVTEEANGPMPTDLYPAWPSNYLVFPTISAGNACTQLGTVLHDHTIAFNPGELSTIEANTGATKVFNFADLPCPPPDVASANQYFYNPSWNPGRPYSPMISPPRQLFELDPSWKSCVAAIYQGFDPPKTLVARPVDENPDGGPGWGRKRSAPRHNVARGPVQTAAPWS